MELQLMGKKMKNDIFKPPLKFGGVYNPPAQQAIDVNGGN